MGPMSRPEADAAAGARSRSVRLAGALRLTSRGFEVRTDRRYVQRGASRFDL